MDQPVKVTPEGLLIEGKLQPLYSGSVHYWRHDRSNWKQILSGVREMGFRYVCTYMPWNVHEVEPGVFDFGQTCPEKEVTAYLETCQEVGLFVLARPGPHINAELPDFGFPNWIVNDEQIQARTVTGSAAILPIVPGPFALPSYASEKFYEKVGQYFHALAEVIRPYVYPKGPIVTFQADNENSFFFRMHCYDLDYHPESIARYQEMLRLKYGDISALNRAYKLEPGYREFPEVEPPRRFNARIRQDLPYYLDWAEYQEQYIHYGITRVRKMLEARGLAGVPYYHNYPTYYPVQPMNMPVLETEMDIAGVDAYPQLSQYGELKTGAIYTSTMSRLPFISEFMSGVWGWYRPLTAKDERFITQAAFMHGIRAINYYMLAERDRWLACPLKRDGSRREDYFAMYRSWNACLERLQWHQLSPERKVLLLAPRVYDRLRYTAIDMAFPYQWLLAVYTPTPGEIFQSESLLGERDMVQRQAGAFGEAFRVAMDAVGIPYGLGASELSLEALSDYPVVIAPTFEWADEELMGKLKAYVEAGGNLICGPRWPVTSLFGKDLKDWPSLPQAPRWMDRRVDLVNPQAGEQQAGFWLEGADLWSPDQLEREPEAAVIQLQPGQEPAFVRSFEMGKGTVTLVAAAFPAPVELEQGSAAYRIWAPWVSALLKKAGVSSHWICDNPALDVSVLSGGGRRVVCVANPSSEEQQAWLTLPGVSRWDWVNVWDDVEPISVTDGERISFRLKPWTISIWEVT